MSELRPELTALDLSEEDLEALKPWARLFDQMTKAAPPRPGDRYTAGEFIEWLTLEHRARGRDQVTQNRRDGWETRRLRDLEMRTAS